MFNKPEGHCLLVRLHSNDGNYWEAALKYMIEGNVQAMLDEFVYLLIDGENMQSTTELIILFPYIFLLELQLMILKIIGLSLIILQKKRKNEDLFDLIMQLDSERKSSIQQRDREANKYTTGIQLSIQALCIGQYFHRTGRVGFSFVL